MLIASMAISVLFAHFTFRSWVRWITFVVAMIVASLLANALRAYLVVMIGHYIGMDAINGHEMLGYVVFGSVIIVMLLIGSRFADKEFVDPPPADQRRFGSKGLTWLSALTAAVLIVVSFSIPPAASMIEAAAQNEKGSEAPILPASAGAWRGLDLHVDSVDWSPVFFGYDTARFGQYGSEVGIVDAYLIWYRHQRQETH